MVVVYRVPENLDPETRRAFEERGVRLRAGDRVVLEPGERPVVMRELDPAIIPFVQTLPRAEEAFSVRASRPDRRRRREDRGPFPRLHSDGDERDQTA